MTKLTNAIRGKIKYAMVEDFKRPREEELKKREHALAAKVLDTYLGGDDLKRTFMAAPREWFNTGKTIRWQADKHKLLDASLKEYSPIPYALVQGTVVINHPMLVSLHDDLEQAHESHKAACRDLGIKIDAVLYSVTTIKQLLVVWPEVAPYLPQTAHVVNLPAPSTGELNKLLGLKPVQQAKAS